MRPFLKQVEESELESLQRRLESFSSFSLDFLVFLSGSTFIATLGLFQNSPAVIIGAMIIAPLMRPLVALSLATLTADSKLLVRGALTLFIGTILGVVISSSMALLFRSLELTPEILGRTRPTLLDLGVAMFAGAVGAYCQTNTKLSDTLAGVAIAVALVPPLSVVGIGLAMGAFPVWSGAGLLYATNLIGITVAGSLVFLIMGFIPLHQAKKGLMISAAVSLLLIVPLGLSMRELILENQISIKVKQLLKEKTTTFKTLQLVDAKVERFKKPMKVLVTVLASEQEITSRQVAFVQDFLIRQLKTPLEFKLRIIPVREIGAVEVTPQSKEPVLLGPAQAPVSVAPGQAPVIVAPAQAPVIVSPEQPPVILAPAQRNVQSPAPVPSQTNTLEPALSGQEVSPAPVIQEVSPAPVNQNKSPAPGNQNESPVSKP